MVSLVILAAQKNGNILWVLSLYFCSLVFGHPVSYQKSSPFLMSIPEVDCDLIITGVPKQADKCKVIKLIKNMSLLGCQYNQTDHKCWLFDISYKDSWIFSNNSHYGALICNNAKAVKFSYWDCLQNLWYFWIFYYLKNTYIFKVFINNANYDL